MKFYVTELGTFRRCHRMAALTSHNGRNLEPIVGPMHLAAGTLVHRTLQHWTADPNTPIQDHAMRVSSDIHTRLLERYQEKVGTQPSETEFDPYYEAVQAALAMCINYETYYQKPLPHDYTFLAKEQTLELQIGEHILHGTVDTLVQHGKRIGAVDHKTYNSRPRDDAIRYNDQFAVYAFMLRELGIAPEPFILYDGLWRREVPPRGKILADLFKRQTIVYTKHELDEIGDLLPRLLDQMAAMYTAAFYDISGVDRNRQWVGCWDCRVSSICNALSMGEDYHSVIETGYQTREDHAEEEE